MNHLNPPSCPAVRDGTDVKERSIISPTPKRALLRPKKLSRGVRTPVTLTTVATAVRLVPPHPAVTCLLPVVDHLVVKVGPTPLAGLPPGATHRTPARARP